jgi:ribose transport system ATP-binding protein
MSKLQTRKLVKVYPGTVALNDISVSFESGKIHALVGKNGCGKSTLLKIFAGAVKPTQGEVLMDGVPLNFNSPRDAFDKGISTIYQELSLVPGMSVAENILMGRLPMKGKFVDWKKTYKITKDLLKELNVEISPGEKVYNLSMWKCQMVEIVKAMSSEPRVLLLDEPTSSLAFNEIQSLFKMLREMKKKKDIIIIYVTHRLQELWEIADTCTVLRDGQFIDTKDIKDVTHKEVINMMFGDVEIHTRPEDLKHEEKVVLEVKELTRKNCFENISFTLKKGEILGIAGMLGSGRTELLKSIFGADKFDSGSIIYKGKQINSPSPVKMKRMGIALTPEDRKREGLVQIMSIKKNLCVAGLEKITPGLFIKSAIENEFVKRQVEDLQIKTPSTEHPVSSLSGGNQQKVVVGNWLNIDPEIMFFDEPSRGIDINAKQQIFQIIWDQSRKGISSIMVSSELEELMEVCHRILIMRHGKITGEVRPENLKIEELYSLSMGGEQS